MSIRFVPAALIAAFIALVAIGGATFAFGRGGDGSVAIDDLLDRTAVELGVDSQALQDALAQAQSELSLERQQELLARLVDDEVITQEQADEASVWLQQMPAAVDKLMRPELLLRLAAISGPGIILESSHSLPFLPFGQDVTEKMAEILGIDADELANALENARSAQAADSREQAINDLIDGLVGDGTITRVEGDEIKSWIAAMPKWLSDHRLLLQMLVNGPDHGIGPRFDPGTGNGGPFFFAPGGQDFHLFPNTDEQRERGHAFPSPKNPLELPRFGFGNGDGPGRQFFFHGPDGQFEFNGEVPEDFKGLLDRLRERFGEEFDPTDLDGLFESFAPFQTPPVRQPPGGGDPGSVSQKGA